MDKDPDIEAFYIKIRQYFLSEWGIDVGTIPDIPIDFLPSAVRNTLDDVKKQLDDIEEKN